VYAWTPFIIIVDMDQFGRINAIDARYFATDPPARACAEMARQAKNVGIEIEAVAIVR
jgi:2-iminobutanoate/2-iminopropanoate deaminase